MRLSLVLVAVLVTSAHASLPNPRQVELLQAIHKDDVEFLRARIATPPADETQDQLEARCALAIVYAHKKDRLRGALHFSACDRVWPFEEDDGTKSAARDVRKELREFVRRAHKELALKDSELSQLQIISGDPMVAEISAIPGEYFVVPTAVWVPAGTHEIRAAADIASLPHGIKTTTTVIAHSRGAVVLEAPKAEVISTKVGVVDMTEGGNIDHEDGPPPDVKHKTMLPQKYIDGGTAGGPTIRDPFDDAGRPIRDAEATNLRYGLRAGAGIVNAGETYAGITFGPVVTFRVASRLSAVARLDYERRERSMESLNAIAVGAGLSQRLSTRQALTFDLGIGLRSELRLQDKLGDHEIKRAGAAFDIGFDMSLRHVPIVIGARYEQGITTLYNGIRPIGIQLEFTLELR